MATTYTPAAAIQSIASMIEDAYTRMPRFGLEARAMLLTGVIGEIHARIKQTTETTQAPQQLEILTSAELETIRAGLSIALDHYQEATHHTEISRQLAHLHARRAATLAILRRLES